MDARRIEMARTMAGRNVSGQEVVYSIEYTKT